MKVEIRGFQGEYRWLSNFWLTNVMLYGIQFGSVESAYQAAKTLDKDLQKKISDFCPADAKRIGKTIPMRPDWNDVKIDVMRFLLSQKFAPYTPMADKIIDTCDAVIIEDNHWGDTFWGVCRGQGQNHLGRLLMEQRTNLRWCRG